MQQARNVKWNYWVSCGSSSVLITGIVSNGQFVRVSVPAGRFSDAAGNQNTASTSTDNTITIDNVIPTVTIDQAIGQADPTATLPLKFTVVFSEPVTGVDASELLINGLPATNVTGSSFGPYVFSFPPPVAVVYSVYRRVSEPVT